MEGKVGRGEEERREEYGRRCYDTHNSHNWKFKTTSCTHGSTSAEGRSLASLPLHLPPSIQALTRHEIMTWDSKDILQPLKLVSYPLSIPIKSRRSLFQHCLKTPNTKEAEWQGFVCQSKEVRSLDVTANVTEN